MSAAPFPVAVIVDRIKAAVPTLRKVGRAADYASVRSLGDFPVPCAYILLAREKGDTSKSGVSLPGQQTRLAQVMSVSFGVVLAVRNYREQAGAQLADELESCLGAVRNALLGWTPDVPGGRACQLLQGDLTQYDQATALWTDVWRTQHIIQPEIST